MKTAKMLSCLSIIVLIFAATVCSAGDEGSYVIFPGDTLDISVWGQPDLGRKVEVSPQGEFTFPPLGQVKAEGLTVFELEKRLQDGLSGRFLINPQVSVAMAAASTSRKMFILGEVRKPASYLMSGRTTLSQLLAEAGGLSEKAGNTVIIVRPRAADKYKNPVLPAEAGQDETITQDLRQFAAAGAGQQFVLVPGDTVYVPDAPKFYVTGEVKKSGEFKWEDGITVRQAVSMAGGPTDRGAPNRTEIVRTINGAEQSLRPSMSDTVLGGDVVKIPLSYF